MTGLGNLVRILMAEARHHRDEGNDQQADALQRHAKEVTEARDDIERRLAEVDRLAGELRGFVAAEKLKALTAEVQREAHEVRTALGIRSPYRSALDQPWSRNYGRRVKS